MTQIEGFHRTISDLICILIIALISIVFLQTGSYILNHKLCNQLNCEFVNIQLKAQLTDVGCHVVNMLGRDTCTHFQCFIQCSRETQHTQQNSLWYSIYISLY